MLTLLSWRPHTSVAPPCILSLHLLPQLFFFLVCPLFSATHLPEILPIFWSSFCSQDPVPPLWPTNPTQRPPTQSLFPWWIPQLHPHRLPSSQSVHPKPTFPQSPSPQRPSPSLPAALPTLLALTQEASFLLAPAALPNPSRLAASNFSQIYCFLNYSHSG